MKVKFIIPALSELRTPHYRQIKYSLFAPLGMAQLAAYLDDSDEAEIQDENVERLKLDDQPDVVAIDVRTTSAYRAYELADLYAARGSHVCLGGLHATAMPKEAALHANSIFLGPGEDTWPRFLSDFRAGVPQPIYQSQYRCLAGEPRPRRDLVHLDRYLVSNTIMLTRGCPHQCSFCTNSVFFAGGRHYYTRPVDEALAEIDSLPGRHLYFLDDHLLGCREFAEALFDGMQGMGRVWQTAASVDGILAPGLLEKAAGCGLRSLIVGFETINDSNLRSACKPQNTDGKSRAAIKRMHDNGVLVNATFVFGFDGDDEDVFDRTVDWAIENGVETATFHILTPFPGTPFFSQMMAEARILTTDWTRYDTCQAVFRPARMSPEALEAGYRRAYRRFYEWRSIWSSAALKQDAIESVRHLLYAGMWHTHARAWDLAIRCHALPCFRPMLPMLLDGCRREPETEKVDLTPALS